MKILTYISTFVAISLFSCSSKPDIKLIGIYIEPYYNSSPFKINVGSYSEALKTADEKTILDVAQKIKSNIDKVDLITMYMLSTRLYDLNKKDEAVYWFYTASFRRNVFKQIALDSAHGTETGELIQALDSYKTLLGEYVNGYALGQIDKNIENCKAVIADNSNMKSLSMAYPTLKFDETKLPEAVKNAVKDREEFIKYMDDNRAEIKAKRTENGIDGKY
ncbi:hypothetical protein EZJ43_13340 [Pedobacter changchengzhani]|uniref:Lipoprotein n=1 Tax=Pedobacter changchengzhani TaxID=2529274 RepID=A0A4R5MKI2_9SPHI|nr:hypothetical protein [Pedobacter changchengzhani]TDG35599.1 hypothetical protein EZJ43_13340 [Pedobacter changchengzhani]